MLRRAGRIASRIAKSTSSKSTVLAAPRLTVPSPFFKNIARGYYSNNSQEAAFEPQIGVSKSYTDITTEKMEDFLIRNRVVYKVRPNGQVVIKECPFCTRPHNNKITNLWTLNLKENNGAFLCFRCGSHGSWYDFVRYILGDTINFDSRRTRDAVVEGSSTEDEVRLRNERTKLVVEESCKMHMDLLATIEKLEKLESQEEKSEENQNKGEKEDVDIDLKSGLIGINTLEYLVGTENNTQRHLSIETLKAFKIGIGEEAFKNDEGELIRVPVVNYPLFKPTAKKSKKPSDCNLIDNTLYDCVRSKLRGVGPSHKHHQRFKPAGGHFGVFGLNLVTPSSKVGYELRVDSRRDRR
jgi:twinkle protein